MGLLRLTVLTKNSDSGAAGTVLFNSKYMDKLRSYATNDSFFVYRNMDNVAVGDKYTVNEAIAASKLVYNAVSNTYYLLPVHDDVNDSSSATTLTVIDPDDIIKGVAFPSDISKSLLWIQEGSVVRKLLVNQYLKAIYDYVMTGTTTTYA